MKSLFKIFTLLFVLCWAFALNAQDIPKYEISPNLVQKIPPYNTEAMWDVLLNFDISALNGAAGNAGAEWNGTYFYSTRWASNLIHEYNSTGTTLIREFSVPGVSGLRDLAWDGTYMYGGAAANTIYQMDFATNTLIGTIASTQAVRFIAYDAGADAFWVGNWSTPAVLINRSGVQIGQITTGLSSQYGAAYDDISAGGPYLWIWDQGAGSGTPQLIHQFHIPTGTATGVTHDVGSDVGLGSASGIAGGLFSMCDWQSGTFTIGGCWQGGFPTPPDNDRIFVYEITSCGPPCPVGAPTDPNPPDGTTNVSINLPSISWTNGAGTTQVELLFGPAGNVVSVYSGSPISSWNIPAPLEYMTVYQWRVLDKNDTCTTTGPMWSFTTEQNPLIVEDTLCVYPQNADYWTGTCNSSTKTQTSLVNAMGTELGWMVFDVTGFPASTQTILSIEFNGYLNNNNWPYWSVTPMGSVNPITGTASVIYNQVSNNYQQGVAYSYNTEPGTLPTGWLMRPLGTSAPADLLAALPQGWFAIGIVDWDFSTTYFVTFDGWNEPNDPYLCVIYQYIIPVELTSFTAEANDNKVELSWITATETNNSGFQIERSSGGGEFEAIGFVNGHGTTTETQIYTFTDKNVNVGTYSYRLKQIDYDGTYEYSKVVEVDVLAPKVFSLSQNYPNPFNPTTKVEFSLAVDSKVSLKVFDVLGQEVLNVVNSDFVAGIHTVDINASALNSGVYFYKIEANGVNGTKYVDMKKMILAK